MKKIFCLIIVLALLAGAVFAGGSNETKDGAKVIRIKLASQYAVDHFTTKMLYEFAQKIEDKTNGMVNVTVYPAGQLGDYTQIYDELRQGSIDMANISIPGQYDERLDICYVHYLAMNYAEAEKIYKPGSELCKIVDELHNAQGVKFLGFCLEGFGQFGLTKMPTDPKDPTKPKNLLLRCPPINVFRETADDQGWQTITIAYAELYTALQTKIAEGVTGLPAQILYNNYGDVVKVVIRANNFFENTSYLFSKKVWDKLTPEYQKIFQDAATELSMATLAAAKENDEKYIKLMKESPNIQVVELTDAELKVWADQARKVTWPRMEKQLTKELVDRLLKSY
jgi:TRAP-type C4-dicarboxylate transport system substrate-binding protein